MTQQSEPQVGRSGRVIPLRTLLFLVISIGVGFGGSYVPDIGNSASLTLAMFLTLDRLHRQVQ
ncbi:hypothetical protein [Micromonospora sp. DT227]|uniref:hypothetical protein n=1 Tax=Micromonospora sp. DT227 TaxID=3393433 RepID=UPI003CF5622F